MWTSGHGCVPVTPYVGNWMRGLVRPRHSSTAVASLLTHLCTSSPSPAPPRVSLGTPRFSRYHLFLLLTAPAAPHPWLAFPFIPALPYAILTALYSLVTLMKSRDSCGQSYAGAFNQRAACAQRVSKDPRRGGPGVRLVSAHGASWDPESTSCWAGRGWYLVARAQPE